MYCHRKYDLILFYFVLFYFVVNNKIKMDLVELRKYRLDFEEFPYYNSKSVGIALFDVITAFLGAWILDRMFNLSNYLPFCKNKTYIYYLLVIPFGIVVHHAIAHYQSKTWIPQEMTYLNKKLFSLKPNIYHLFVFLLIAYIVKSCE